MESRKQALPTTLLEEILKLKVFVSVRGGALAEVMGKERRQEPNLPRDRIRQQCLSHWSLLFFSIIAPIKLDASGQCGLLTDPYRLQDEIFPNNW